MDTSYSCLRQNLKQTIDWTIKHHEPAFVTSHKKRKAVLMGYDDYCSLEETAYLLKSPANAKRLLQAISDQKDGRNVKKLGLMDEN